MDAPTESKFSQFKRATLEVAFIIFLFYANLLMGEFTAANQRGKTMSAALHNIVTPTNLAIAVAAAVVGHFLFESLRRRL